MTFINIYKSVTFVKVDFVHINYIYNEMSNT